MSGNLDNLASGVTDVLCKIITEGRADCHGLPQSADISAAINWLKHNNISINANEREKADELRQRVQEALGKRQRAGMAPLDLDEDDEATQ